jgi:HEAT repeat protein
MWSIAPSNRLKTPMNLKYAPLLVFSLLVGCSSEKNPNSFADPTRVKIADLKDHRQTDSLLLFLHHADVRYRRQAAQAFASVQDSLAASQLGNLLLEDPDTLVQRYAAHALGQTKGYQSVNALIPALTNKNPYVLSEVLEALGKTASANEVSPLLTFTPNDTITESGVAWGIYRLGVRGLANEDVLKKALSLLDIRKSYSTQLGIAHFFSRANFQLPPDVPEELINATRSDYAEVRMALANALRKLPTEKSRGAIAALQQDDDYRVRINETRALRPF